MPVIVTPRHRCPANVACFIQRGKTLAYAHPCGALLAALQMTEFVIATIPTYMAVDESARLLQALRKDNIPCKRIVVNQVQHCINAQVVAQWRAHMCVQGEVL